MLSSLMEASISWGGRKKLGTTGSDLSRTVKEQLLAVCSCTEVQMWKKPQLLTGLK